MTVRVLFFAHYADIVGRRERAVTLPPGASVRDLAARLEGEFALGDLLAQGRVAVDAEFAHAGTALYDGAEVAWMPPMSGGC